MAAARGASVSNVIAYNVVDTLYSRGRRAIREISRAVRSSVERRDIRRSECVCILWNLASLDVVPHAGARATIIDQRHVCRTGQVAVVVSIHVDEPRVVVQARVVNRIVGCGCVSQSGL